MSTTPDALNGADWFKSSYSNDQGGQCVEVARVGGGAMAVRDSKDPHGPAFVFSSTAWTAFVSTVKSNEPDSKGL